MFSDQVQVVIVFWRFVLLSNAEFTVAAVIEALRKMHPCQVFPVSCVNASRFSHLPHQICFRFWKHATHAQKLQKQDAANFMSSFRAWKNLLTTRKAQHAASEALREKDALKLHYQMEIDRLKHQSTCDLEFEREQFNISIS
jgi:hypothetical protein